MRSPVKACFGLAALWIASAAGCGSSDDSGPRVDAAAGDSGSGGSTSGTGGSGGTGGTDGGAGGTGASANAGSSGSSGSGNAGASGSGGGSTGGESSGGAPSSGGQGAMDGGIDGSASVDGGPGGAGGAPDGGGDACGDPTPNYISCSGATCDLSSSWCCIGLAGICAFPGVDCVAGGYEWQFHCDDASDCDAGEVCCRGTGATFDATCATECAPGEVQVCETCAECRGGFTCVYNSCQ